MNTVTIHASHPFDDGSRDPVRQFRGRMPSAVSVWTCGQHRPAGLTVSSFVVADGDPPHVLGLIDDESDFIDELEQTWVVNLLGDGHQFLAEAFAGLAPAPGGRFTLGEWEQTTWGPRLVDAVGWLGVRLAPSAPARPGWNLLIDGVIEQAHAGDGVALVHRRGRYEA